MKILVLTLFVCAVKGANLGGLFGAGVNTAANIFGVGSNRNGSPNPIEVAARVITAPAVAAHAVASDAAEIAAPIAVSAARIVAAPAAAAVDTASVAFEGSTKASANAVVFASHTGSIGTANVATAVSRSASADSESEIIRYDAEVRTDGFSYSYETSNGIVAESTGELKKVNETEVIVMKGSYKYTDKEGNAISLTYIADENGFQPESDILPTAPPVPEEIARAIAYILSQIKAGKNTEEGN